jgi:hypothetical protein
MNMAFEYGPYLDELFLDVETLLWELSDNDDSYFTNYAFFRRVAQAHKGAYIRFLYAMVMDRGEEFPFNLVHQAIGARLSSVAQNLGYEQNKNPNVEDYDVFGTVKKSGVVTYARTTKVR